MSVGVITTFLMLMPFGLWESMGKYWNHCARRSATEPGPFFCPAWLLSASLVRGRRGDERG